MNLIERLRDAMPPHHGKCLAAATEIERLTAQVERMRETLERCAEIVDRNLYRQHEKVEDVPKIARAALSYRGGDCDQ